MVGVFDKLKEVFVMLMLLLAFLQNSYCIESSFSTSSVTSFKDCYIKCYVFCMIEPSQTLCTCTTRCFKDCILPSTSTTQSRDDSSSDHYQNIAFCKLGCASTTCSSISRGSNPNGENVESCVGSCSNKCIKTYSSP